MAQNKSAYYGPSTYFEADAKLLHLNHYNEDPKKFWNTPGSQFVIILVAGWPSKPDFLSRQYNDFVTQVQKCFDPDDFIQSNDSIRRLPSVYLYPSEALHVTVATLYPPSSITIDNPSQTHIIQLWNDVLLKASQLESWPKQPLKLKISSSQIGVRAGILQWEETTGGILAMRASIKEILEGTKSCRTEADQQLIQKIFIPNIVHTTFLRFSKVPKMDGAIVQSRFQKFVEPMLKTIFPREIILDTATLVCERTPYMHIPIDDHHVLQRFAFEKNNVI